MARKSVTGEVPLSLCGPVIDRPRETPSYSRGFIGPTAKDTLENCADVARFMGNALSTLRGETIVEQWADAIHVLTLTVHDSLKWESVQATWRFATEPTSGSLDEF